MRNIRLRFLRIVLDILTSWVMPRTANDTASEKSGPSPNETAPFGPLSKQRPCQDTRSFPNSSNLLFRNNLASSSAFELTELHLEVSSHRRRMTVE